MAFVVPLMDQRGQHFYSCEALTLLFNESIGHDDEMKNVVIILINQFIKAQGISSSFVRAVILPEFITNF